LEINFRKKYRKTTYRQVRISLEKVPLDISPFLARTYEVRHDRVAWGKARGEDDQKTQKRGIRVTMAE
jgi:hypothetical protein